MLEREVDRVPVAKISAPSGKRMPTLPFLTERGIVISIPGDSTVLEQKQVAGKFFSVNTVLDALSSTRVFLGNPTGPITFRFDDLVSVFKAPHLELCHALRKFDLFGVQTHAARLIVRVEPIKDAVLVTDYLGALCLGLGRLRLQDRNGIS